MSSFKLRRLLGVHLGRAKFGSNVSSQTKYDADDSIG